MNNIWLVILKEALDGLVARLEGPVAGAKLRAAVKRLADDRGEAFPPAGMGKWSSFLASFPDDITVIPHPGSDVLVVPASRLDLRAQAEATVSAGAKPAPKQVRLRSDIFEALTRIPFAGEHALYLPETDAVLWQGPQEAAPANAVPFPQTTFDSELRLRREFVEAPGGPSDMAKDALINALNSDGPLRAFTHTIRSYGLIQEWHFFRMEALTRALREWATSHALLFKNDWLGSDEPRAVADPANALAAVSAGSKRGLVELATLLTEEDIARISVPLDVVLRLLSNR